MIDSGDVGETTYTVAAYNSAGKSVTKSFTIKVVDESLAKIVNFDVDPLQVNPIDGKVKISWHVTSAIQVKLAYTGLTEPYILEAVGSREIPVVGKTTFTLTATDAKGKTVSINRTVTIKEPVPPVDNNAPPTDGTTGTTGTTTGL